MGKCKKCNKNKSFLTQRGNCKRCKELISEEVKSQLRGKQGSYYDNWKAGMLKFSKGLPQNDKPKVRVKK